MNRTYLIRAAGGNTTAIKVINSALSRQEYARQGKILGDTFASLGVEQAGFLIPSAKHFEMAGGEFCGNATRAAALLLSALQGAEKVELTVSGYKGTVSGQVHILNTTNRDVEVTLPGLPTTTSEATLRDGSEVSVVDLGGIVHVIIDGRMPENYETTHKAITQELGLAERDAVGVVWLDQDGDSVRIHPVVWVRDVDTFFYEQSCGSGTIATAKVTGRSVIVQPTGKSIEAHITPTSVSLRSIMEIAHVFD